MVPLLVFLLVVAIAFTAVIVVRHAEYKAEHPFTASDLANARQDSLERSRHVTLGKTQEHLAPLFPEFLSQFNPNDARFLGSPVDFVVFDGLCEGEGTEVRRVVFVEVKSGKASLSKRERRVRDAVQAGRVEYRQVRLPGAIELEPGAAAIRRDLADAPSSRPALGS